MIKLTLTNLLLAAHVMLKLVNSAIVLLVVEMETVKLVPKKEGREGGEGGRGGGREREGEKAEGREGAVKQERERKRKTRKDKRVRMSIREEA